MRFRNTSDRPPWLNRRDQFRLLRLAGLLALVLVSMQMVAKPGFWWWMFPGGPAGPRDAESAAKEEAARGKKIDFGVKLEDADGRLPPGVFRTVKKQDNDGAPTELKSDDDNPGNDASVAAAVPTDSKHGAGDEDAASGASGDVDDGPQSPTLRDSSGQINVRLDPEILADVEDSTIGIRSSERDAFYTVLSRAGDTPLSYLERAARDDVSFTRMMVDTEELRGTLLTVEGEVKRIAKLTASHNTHDVETFYEAWLLNADSNPRLYRLVCTEIPEGVPTGDLRDQSIDARFTGYLFKREGYASEGGLQSTPLLIGRRMRWFPPRIADEVPESNISKLLPWVAAGMLLIGAVLGVCVWRFSKSDRRFQQSHLKRLTKAPETDIAALADFPVLDESQMFEQVAAEVEAEPLAAGPVDVTDEVQDSNDATTPPEAE